MFIPTKIGRLILLTNTMYLCIPANSSYSFKFLVHFLKENKVCFALYKIFISRRVHAPSSSKYKVLMIWVQKLAGKLLCMFFGGLLHYWLEVYVLNAIGSQFELLSLN